MFKLKSANTFSVLWMYSGDSFGFGQLKVNRQKRLQNTWVTHLSNLVGHSTWHRPRVWRGCQTFTFKSEYKSLGVGLITPSAKEMWKGCIRHWRRQLPMIYLQQIHVGYIGQLSDYQRILNNDLKEWLWWRYAHEVYYGRDDDYRKDNFTNPMNAKHITDKAKSRNN
jgi:hypothetical protein